MFIIATFLGLLVLSGVGTALLAGAAAVMLNSEIDDVQSSIYDQAMDDDMVVTSRRVSYFVPRFSAPNYAEHSTNLTLAELRPLSTYSVSCESMAERERMGSVMGSLSVECIGDLVAASTKQAERVGRVIRRRSVFVEESRKLSVF